MLTKSWVANIILNFSLCCISFSQVPDIDGNLIVKVPDYSQPPLSLFGCNPQNFCVPTASANIITYWDSVVADTNTKGVNAGFLGMETVDYLGFFMATNGNTDTLCGSRSRGNAIGKGTFTEDIVPGLLEYVRWDQTHPHPFVPPIGLPASKFGFDWVIDLDTVIGFQLVKQEIDSGRPPMVIFEYWNPIQSAIKVKDTITSEIVEIFTMGPPIQSSQQNDPQNFPEEWPCIEEPCPRGKTMGHAVTAVGYIEQYDPDGPLPQFQHSDWVIVHDNWLSTNPNVMIDWKAWNGTVTMDPILKPPPPVAVAMREGFKGIFKISDKELIFKQGQKGTIEIWDLVGNKMSVGSFNENKKRFKLTGLNSGLYFLRVKSQDFSNTIRILIP